MSEVPEAGLVKAMFTKLITLLNLFGSRAVVQIGRSKYGHVVRWRFSISFENCSNFVTEMPPAILLLLFFSIILVQIHSQFYWLDNKVFWMTRSEGTWRRRRSVSSWWFVKVVHEGTVQWRKVCGFLLRCNGRVWFLLRRNGRVWFLLRWNGRGVIFTKVEWLWCGIFLSFILQSKGTYT